MVGKSRLSDRGLGFKLKFDFLYANEIVRANVDDSSYKYFEGLESHNVAKLRFQGYQGRLLKECSCIDPAMIAAYNACIAVEFKPHLKISLFFTQTGNCSSYLFWCLY